MRVLAGQTDLQACITNDRLYFNGIMGKDDPLPKISNLVQKRKDAAKLDESAESFWSSFGTLSSVVERLGTPPVEFRSLLTIPQAQPRSWAFGDKARTSRSCPFRND